MTACLPKGFAAASVAAGIKASGAPDLALVATSGDAGAVSAAAVFTLNLAAAAPVQVSRRNLASSGRRAGAVVINSGCANAATGRAGLATADRTARIVAAGLGLERDQVLVCSTGVIGAELPFDPIARGVPALLAALESSEDALRAAARAIMTTDTREKLAAADLPNGAHVGAIAKGAAMVAPNMATMLAVIMTDADVPPEELQSSLAAAVAVSFNRLSIDGCTSTNDTVIALASGAGSVSRPLEPGELTAAFTAVCKDLAHQMASDAEGGTKAVRVVISGAIDDESARIAARKVADANLVKCSWYGADPNWGRVVSEIGTAGIEFDPDRVEVSYGPFTVCRAGIAAAHDEAALAVYLKGPEIEIRCEIGLGKGTGEILSADLTHGYIDENMGLS
jgi:glutamate N-acetyltransferase/amino-acid N-acetyltransferase